MSSDSLKDCEFYVIPDMEDIFSHKKTSYKLDSVGKNKIEWFVA